MRLKNTDLIVALAISILNVLCILIPITLPWLRIILALPLIFVLPGYMLTETLFYRRKIAMSHHLLLTLGLSIVIIIISGLLLNLLASGLQSVSWVVCLSLITVTGILIVMIRRRKVPGREIRIKVLHIYQYFLFGLALLGTIFALGYAKEGMAEQPHPGFTQFWLLPAGGSAVKLGIHSFESGQMAYSVLVTANNVPMPTQFPGVLKVGEQVERTISLPASVQGETINVQARLYLSDKPAKIYRSVNLILKRSSPGLTYSNQPLRIHGSSQAFKK